jgi:hypothetical protein
MNNEAAVCRSECRPDGEGLCVEIDVIPGQTAQLAGAQPGEHRSHQQRPQRARMLEHRAQFVFRQASRSRSAAVACVASRPGPAGDRRVPARARRFRATWPLVIASERIDPNDDTTMPANTRLRPWLISTPRKLCTAAGVSSASLCRPRNGLGMGVDKLLGDNGLYFPRRPWPGSG